MNPNFPNMNAPPSYPTSPPVFVGHFGLAQSNDGCPCIPGHELLLPGVFNIEGIHVVPGGFSPPGLPLLGQTSPTMAVRPFTLHMFARNCSDSQIVPVFALTITGGVQWMAIPPPFNSMNVDLIAFDGDYETLSIIIHAFPCESFLGMSKGVPEAVDEYTDESEPEEPEPVNPINEDSPLYQVQASALATRVVSNQQLNNRLKKLSLKPYVKQDMQAKIESHLSCTFFGNSLVSLQHVAMLVGEIFSFAESYSQADGQSNKTAESFTSQIGLLNKLSEYLTACWKEPEATDGKDSVISAIGPEAANLLCSIVVNALIDCNFDTFLVGSIESAEERSDLFEKYTSAVLLCCSAVMGNAYIAVEFNECNGVPALCALLRQQSHLTSTTFIRLLECLLSAVKHYDIAVKFNEPVEDQQYIDEQGNAYMQQEISPYQSLLYIAAGLTGDAEATPLCGQIYRWCALVESLSQLVNYTYTVFDDIAKVSEALAARLAAVNSNTGAASDEAEDGANDGTVDTGALLHPCSEIVATLYHTLSAKVHSLQSSIVSCLHDLRKSSTDESYSQMCPLLQCFSRGKLMIVLISLASLSQVTTDLSLAVDWKAPHSNELGVLFQSCQHLFVGLLNHIVSIPHFETLFAFHSEEVQILFKILSSHTNMVTSFNMHELLRMKDLSPADIPAVLVSYGWSVWLSSYYFTLSLNALSKVKLDPDSASSPFSEPSALSASQVEGLSVFLRETTELAAHHVSRAWVVRIISCYFMSDVISVLHRLCVHIDEYDDVSSLLAHLFALLEMCCESSRDVRAIQVAHQHQDGVKQVAEELKVLLKSVDGLDKKLSKDKVSRLIGSLGVPGTLIETLESFSVRTIVDEAENTVFRRGVSIKEAALNGERAIVIQKATVVIEKCTQFLKDLQMSFDKDTTEGDTTADHKDSENPESILSSQPSAKRKLIFCTTILSTVSSLLTLVDRACLLSLRQNVSTCDKLARAVIELDVLLYNFFNGTAADDTGALYREVSTLSVSVLTRFCPSRSDSGLDSCLVPFLVSKAFQELSNFEAVTALISALLPCWLDSKAEEFEILPANDVWSSFALKKSHSEIALIHDWDLFLTRSFQSKPELVLNPMIVVKHSKRKLDHNDSESNDVSGDPDQLMSDLKNKKVTLETLIVGGMRSSSAGVLGHIAIIMDKLCCLSFESGRKACLAATRALKIIVESMTNGVSGEPLQRLLVWLDRLCQSSQVALMLVYCGILGPVVEILESSSNGHTVFLTLQLLESVYRRLSLVSSTANEEPFKYATLIVLEGLAYKLTKSLPQVVRKSTDFSNSLAVLQLVPITVQLLTSQHYQAFLNNLSAIGEGVTLEFVAVKLWIAFEDAFKQISESSDPRKSKSKSRSHDAENGESGEAEKKAYDIHIQCERTAWSLNAIVDITLKAYSEGWINLQVLTRAMRTTQTDPKKIIRRIQRAYTMWSTSLLATVDEDGAYHRSSHHTVDHSGCLRSLSENDSFESRHALLSYALKSLVDSMNVVSKHVQSRERISPSSNKVSFPSGIINLDFKAPFSASAAKYPNIETQFSRMLFEKRALKARLSGLTHRFSLDTLHADFRGDMVKYALTNSVDGFSLKFKNNVADSLVEIKQRLFKINRKRKLRVKKSEPPAHVPPPSHIPAAQVPPPVAPLGGSFFPSHHSQPPSGFPQPTRGGGAPPPPAPPVMPVVQPPQPPVPAAFNPFVPPPPPPPVFSAAPGGGGRPFTAPAAPVPPVNPFEAPARVDPFTYKPPGFGR